jgi:hypothetical protein
MRYLCGTCALALLLTGCVTAAAAEITRTPEANGLDVITIRGNIEADDHKKFIDIAFDIMQASVILDSRGGYVEAALAIGRFIRLRNYETRVHNGAVCNSACTFIWLAGTFRHLDRRARLGFHSVSKQGKPPYERSEPGNARVAAHLAVMGVPQQVIDLQPKADPCCINYIDHAQAKAWALLSDRPAKQQQALPTPETQQAPTATAPASPKLVILSVRPVTTLPEPMPQQAPATSAPVRGEQPAAQTVSTVDRQPVSTSNALIEWWRPTDFTHRRIPDLWQSAKPVPSPAPAAKVEEPPIAALPKITDRIEPGGHQAHATSAPPLGAQQKVVLYEEDPADLNGKRFIGSAIWRTETVTPAPGQPPELVIRADIEVPERKLALTWSLRRNTDKGLPATHTVEVMFKLPADFPFGGISNVPGILMKQAEQTRGAPLSGLAVKVTSGFFLLGLSSVESEKVRNVQLLKERAWFDIPVVYNNGRRAIVAVEKGTPGERALAEVFQAWGARP